MTNIKLGLSHVMLDLMLDCQLGVVVETVLDAVTRKALLHGRVLEFCDTSFSAFGLIFRWI